MSDDEREALVEFLNVVMRFLMRSGCTTMQAEVLESWQTLYERFVVDHR